MNNRYLIITIMLLFSISVSGQSKLTDTLKSNQDSLKIIIANSKLQKLRDQKSNAIRMQRSQNMARILKDSLGLTVQQEKDIRDINISLEMQKASTFKTYKDRILIAKELQQIESQRPKMYQTVLTKEQADKYEEFKKNNKGRPFKKAGQE